MPWYKVCLSLDDVTADVQFRIQKEFEAFFMTSGSPKDVALFSGAVGDGGVEIFFSPQAGQLARALVDEYHGEESEKPSATKVALFVGHADAREQLLGGQ